MATIKRYLVTERASIDYDGAEYETLAEAQANQWKGAEIFEQVFDTQGIYADGELGELVELRKVE